jgi:DNA-binding HxlR family transcriptional regulator
MQGLGKYHKELRIKTESKIVAFLNLQEFGFNGLSELTRIRRKSLRSTLDSLVTRKIVSKHKNTVPRLGIYYKLNSANREARHLIDVYYSSDRIPPAPIALKTIFERHSRELKKESDSIRKQAEIFKKEVEPYLETHIPDNNFNLWADSIKLGREYAQMMSKTVKIFAIKARLRLIISIRLDIFMGIYNG